MAEMEMVLVRRDLTEKDRAEYAEELASMVGRIEDLEEDKKAYAAGKSVEIKEIQSLV